MMASRDDLLLWEDLETIAHQTENANHALQRVLQSVRAGYPDQPSHQDSQHLNRLLVLTELLNGELAGWLEELHLRDNGVPTTRDT